MPSEFALAIAKRNKETIETVGALRLANDADAELQEVREVLPLLATKCYASFKGEFCWCRSPTFATKPEGDRHDTECRRTRALYQRLRIGGGKKENES